MINFMQTLYSTIESIHDNFGQNQAVSIEYPKFCTHNHENSLHPEKPSLLSVLPCDRQ